MTRIIAAIRRALLLLVFWHKPVKHRRGPGKHTDDSGRWYYFRDLLEKLDTYFYFIRYVRRVDPAAYNMHTKLGSLITSSEGAYEHEDLPAAWRHGQRPAFGMLMMTPGDDKKEDTIGPAFGYFLKTHDVMGYQYLGGDTYDVTTFYVDPQVPKEDGIPCIYRVNVSASGVVTVLKRCIFTYTCIPKNSQIRIPQKHWEYPSGLVASYADSKKRGKLPEGWTVAEHGAWTFRYLIQHWDEGSAGLLVNCKKDGVRATFAIDMLRTPYFFEDRDLVVNQDGKKKRIFHIVRTHERKFKRGTSTYVKSHFRGLRHFYWKGYETTISMPGFHHSDLKGFTASGLVDDRRNALPEGLVNQDALVGTLAAAMEYKR